MRRTRTWRLLRSLSSSTVAIQDFPEARATTIGEPTSSSGSLEVSPANRAPQEPSSSRLGLKPGIGSSGEVSALGVLGLPGLSRGGRSRRAR